MSRCTRAPFPGILIFSGKSCAGEQGDKNVPPPLFMTAELVWDFEWPQMFRLGSESRAQALRCLSSSSEGRSVILSDSECGEREGE